MTIIYKEKLRPNGVLFAILGSRIALTLIYATDVFAITILLIISSTAFALGFIGIISGGSKGKIEHQ